MPIRIPDTLPAREFNAGVAEVIKYGAICDAAFYDWLEGNADAIAARNVDAIDRLIEHAVRNKADVVRQDEKEAGVRALLNFGHSFGHAIESCTAYAEYLHGEAVAIGMVTAARDNLSTVAHPFAFAVAAMLEGKLDKSWARWTRRWTSRTLTASSGCCSGSCRIPSSSSSLTTSERSGWRTCCMG